MLNRVVAKAGDQEVLSCEETPTKQRVEATHLITSVSSIGELSG
jgi:hypothetical protein